MNTNILDCTYMQHLQLQKGVDLIHQMSLPCTVPSYGYHRDEVASGKDLQQLKYFQYKTDSKKNNCVSNLRMPKV